MSSGGPLSIHPPEVQFPFELNKEISCTMQVSNNTDNFITFKVKTTSPKEYWVRPNTGIILPHSTYNILVNMKSQSEPPVDMQCKDKFLLQSVILSPECTFKDISSHMFEKESGNTVDEYYLKVVYVHTPQQPLSATVQQLSYGGSALKPFIADNRSLVATTETSSAHIDRLYYALRNTKAFVYRLIEEKNFTDHLNNKLRRETDSLRREISILEDGKCSSAQGGKSPPFIPENKRKTD